MSFLMGCRVGRFPHSVIVLVVAMMLPPSFWKSLVFRSSELWKHVDWQNMVQSSTLFYVLDRLRNNENGNIFQYSSVKVSPELNEIFYRRLIHEVVRIHRRNYGVEVPMYARSSHKVSQSETAEALQAFQAAKVHHHKKRYEKSRRLLEHAFRLDPDNTDVLVALGEVLEGSWRSVQNEHKPSTHSLMKLSGSSPASEDGLILIADHLYTRALMVNPQLKYAEARKSRIMPLVEEIDQRRFNTIDSKVRQFYRIPDSNPGLRRAKMEQYFRHIYHSNAIEGNTLTLAQTRSILETRLAVGGKSLLEQNEVLGLDAALRFLNSTLSLGHHNTITLSTILELHRHVLSFVDPTEAGNFRRTQVFVADHHPPPPECLSDLMKELVMWLNGDQLSDVHPIELAALTHWKLVYIHPFYDGNGRTARLLMNLILMRAGFPPAIIKLEDRHSYYEHLKTANEGDVRPFIRFIASCTERTIDEYLMAAESQQIEPKDEDLSLHPPVIEPELTKSYSLSWSTWPFALSPIVMHEPARPARHPKRYSDLTDPVNLPQVIYLGG